jgi:chromosome segregation protein
MKLKRLEIYGFKSFAQRTEISFNAGITGIVGPNGSGKSNISDAVRWVLGEQSAKALRGAKMEDVIFNGTQSRKPMPYCEVSLVFDNEDNALNTQYAEVMVTRRAYRSGEGEYYLNKRACRLKDILELFRDTGIGREGYSIIGQGRIDDILSVKGEERRQVFEEAAGIVTYRVRKEEAERRLEKTRDNLVRVGDLIDEISSRLEPLHEQSETAKKYLKLSNRLKALELNIFLVRHDKLKERMASLQALMQEQQAVIDDNENKLVEMGALRDRLQLQQEALEAQFGAARDALQEKNELLTGTRTRRERQAASIQSQENEATRIQEMVKESEERTEELLRLFEESDADLSAKDVLLKKANEDLSGQTELLEKLLHQAEEAEQRLDEHKQRVLMAVNRQSDLKSRETRQITMLAQMESRLAEVSSSAQEQALYLRQLTEALESARQQKTDADMQLKALRDEAAAIEEHLQDKTGALNEKLDALKTLMSRIQSDKSRLNLMEEMSKGYEGYYGAVRKAIAFSRNDPHVHGVVARLIRVPKVYETAIDMILGGTLQHIVTDDEETAKKLIDYLRTNRLGRTTFLPLTAVRSRTLSQDERRVLDLPGSLGIASDLIAFEEVYRGVMENILGRTIIARDLDAAIAIMRAGRYAFSVVTLEGDVMRAGGAMTGGTSQSQSISLLGREREVKELRESLQKMDQEAVAYQDQVVALTQAREETKSLRNTHQALIRDEEIAVAREQERVGNADTALSEAETRLEKTRDAEEQLGAAIAEIEQDLQTATSQSQEVTVDREEMDKQTALLQLEMLRQRDMTELQREKVNRMQLENASLAHAAETLTRDKSRWGGEIAALRARGDKYRQKQAEMAQKLLSEREILVRTENEADRLLNERDHAEQRVRELDTDRKELAQEQRRINDENDLAHKMVSEWSARQHKNELVLSRTADELQTISDHIWNTYELTYAGAAGCRFEERFDLPGGEKEAEDIRGIIKQMGHINVQAVDEYAHTKERYDTMVIQRDDAQRAEEDLAELIHKLLLRMETQFVAEFEKLNSFFGETFARLFGGGKASLQLSDPTQPLSCGIDIVAQPPGKNLQLLSLLSGGERALTAIAILFAMLKLKPTPFCMLDEIEAALDDANIGYFAEYLAEYAISTQFVVVTHRKGTMERCDALYGVAMQEKGISGMVSVNLEDYA